MAVFTGLGATDLSGIAPGYPHRVWPVNPEERASGRISSVTFPNGSVAATMHHALAGILARVVVDEWECRHAERTVAHDQ